MDILEAVKVMNKEPLELTLEQHNAENELINQALSKPIVRVPMLDSLLGTPVEGYEGIYWFTLPEDETEAGLVKSGNGVILPITTHIPTGSETSYRKVLKVINGVKTPVWEVHQRDLNSPHEPYED